MLKELIENLVQNAIRYNNTGGTGLGLAIVKHIVEIHDAKIKMDSAPGIGATISVMF